MKRYGMMDRERKKIRNWHFCHHARRERASEWERESEREQERERERA